MALKITDECIACDACIEPCPVGAIEASDPIYIIDANLCCECLGYSQKFSCVEVCPVDAIVVDRELIEEEQVG